MHTFTYIYIQDIYLYRFQTLTFDCFCEITGDAVVVTPYNELCGGIKDWDIGVHTFILV